MQTGLRSIIFAEYHQDDNFEFNPGDLLNERPVRSIDIPRKLDKNGKQLYNCWGFTLENELDSIYFKDGDEVELKACTEL